GRTHYRRRLTRSITSPPVGLLPIGGGATSPDYLRCSEVGQGGYHLSLNPDFQGWVNVRCECWRMVCWDVLGDGALFNGPTIFFGCYRSDDPVGIWNAKRIGEAAEVL